MYPTHIVPSSFHAQLLEKKHEDLCIQNEDFSDYVDFPAEAILDHETLEANPSYPRIKQQFLLDIDALKEMAHFYIGQQYDAAITSFYNKINDPEESVRDSLLPLFRDTRFQIHRLVRKLKKYQLNEASSSSASNEAPSVNPSPINKDQLASLLEDCLIGIDQCAAGTHTRFTYSIMTLEAAECGLSGSLLDIKKHLFHTFIQSFLFETQREGTLDISEGMEIHWFNSFHNLYCESIGLPLVVDPFAITHLLQDITLRFISAAPFYISANAIVLKMAEQWSEKLLLVLDEQGVLAWINDKIAPSEITGEKITALDSLLFQPLNMLFGIIDNRKFGFLNIFQSDDEDLSYNLKHYNEKIHAWIAHSLVHDISSGSREVSSIFLSVTPSSNNTLYISTIDHLFYWVFQSKEKMKNGEQCIFQSDNHISLQLKHLKSIEFSSWPNHISTALLRQALTQTQDPSDIVDFFLNSFIKKELGKLESSLREILFNILSEKIVKNAHLKEMILKLVLESFKDLSSDLSITAQDLSWLIKTPLLEGVLSALKDLGFNLSLITASLNVWDISSFSRDKILKILPSQDCIRLFKNAFKFKQITAVENLILTEHCDDHLGYLTYDGEPLLHLLAKNGKAEATQYLLNKSENLNINAKDMNDLTALHLASKNGHLECIKVLLSKENISINEKDILDWTALHFATYYGHTECIKALLSKEEISINEKNSSHWTSLHLATGNGDFACIESLINDVNILINEKNDLGTTPLHISAAFGDVKCLDLLLSKREILINDENISGHTALHFAAKYGNLACLKALLLDTKCLPNKMNHKNWSAMHFATQNRHVECLKVLLNTHGILINSKNNQDLTALHLAANYGHISCLNLLLKKKEILINEKGSYNETALHFAAKNGNIDCLNALLKMDDILLNEKDYNNLTPLDLAQHNNQEDCVRALQKAIKEETNIKRTRKPQVKYFQPLFQGTKKK